MSQDVSQILRQNLQLVQASSNLDPNTSVSVQFVNTQMDNITKLLGNAEFFNELKNVVSMIFDRDNDGHFTQKDIALLNEIFTNKEHQALNIMSFCTSLLNAL